MSIILVTGMSGTGKSTLLTELSRRGYETIDTDYNGWCIPSSTGSELVWDESRMTALLAGRHRTIIISGCVSNQRSFYDRFDFVVLLGAPTEVIMQRILLRDTNQYGKTTEEREQILRDIAEVEPRLRATSDIELDARLSVSELADSIERLIKSRMRL